MPGFRNIPNFRIFSTDSYPEERIEVNIPLYILLAIVIFLVWKYWALLIGAGYDPTPMDKVDKMLALAKVTKDDVLYDLGSGDGRILIAATRKYGCRAVGIEADPLRFLISWFKIRRSGLSGRISVKLGNFFNRSISDATVITLFLYKPTNERLEARFKDELKPGTRIVSYIWKMPGWLASEELRAEEIYLYLSH